MRRNLILNNHLLLSAGLLAVCLFISAPAFGQATFADPGLQPNLVELVQEKLLVESAVIQDLDLPQEPWEEFLVDV
ncbi:MAG: hypothetical protein ACYTG7_25395, partial [Planctomycetota bacterium]